MGWVSKFFLRKPLTVRNDLENTDPEISAPVRQKKPVLPWLARKPAPAKTPGPVGKSETPAPVAATSPAEPKPALEKPASTESTFDAMRKARERARNRTEK